MLRLSMLALLPALALGQLTATRTFEVASIKLHEGPLTRMDDIVTAGQRLTAYGSDVRYLVAYAYNLKTFQVISTAPLFDSDTYWDIFAKAEGNSPPAKVEFRQMLQALLAARFQLKVHREMREMPVYALVVAKNGPKLKESAPDAQSGGLFHQNGRNMEVTLPKAFTGDIADALNGTAFFDRHVVDHTGLTGTYDVKLVFTPALQKYLSTPDVNDRDAFHAVEQLGLKLEPRKEPVEILVVDRIEKPSAN
jgi:uncharacterized protein (TIGR03435 family)